MRDELNLPYAETFRNYAPPRADNYGLPPVVSAFIAQGAEFHGQRIAARRAANRPWDSDGE